MLRIALCDDDDGCLNALKDYLREYSVSKQIPMQVFAYRSAASLLSAKNVYHLIFMDIDMSGIDGLDAAREIRKNDTSVKIVYVTGYTDYMDVAFSVHAFGYLVKPLRIESIHRIIDEFIQYSDPATSEIQEFRFLTREGVKTINIMDILYFEYLNRKILIHMKNGNCYWLSNEKISSIAKRMEPYNFVVPHKSFTVNLYQVDYIKGYDIYMVDGSVVPLSQTYSKMFRKKVDVFLKHQV